MTDTAARLRETVERWVPRLEAIDEPAAGVPVTGAWSPKQVVGHLIDSASVNLERFLRARDTDHLDLPGYPQDDWVAAGGYAEAPWGELVELWRLINLQVARVIGGTPTEARTRTRTQHVCDVIAFETVPRSEPTTLGYLMNDYVVHLEHHLASLGV